MLLFINRQWVEKVIQDPRDPDAQAGDETIPKLAGPGVYGTGCRREKSKSDNLYGGSQKDDIDKREAEFAREDRRYHHPNRERDAVGQKFDAGSKRRAFIDKLVTLGELDG